MSRIPFVTLFLVGSVLIAKPAAAATFYVGSCHSGSYTSIQAAVTAVPAGSTVDVCPGTYAEQVVISKSLTLQGITSGNSSQVLITMPTGSMMLATSEYGLTQAQILIVAGQVNLSNLIVNGILPPSSANCPAAFNEYQVGIFYESLTSGTVNEVQVLYQDCNQNAVTGIGILAEDFYTGLQVPHSITIENSVVDNYTFVGISAESNLSAPTLTATIENNSLVASGISNPAGPYYAYGILLTTGVAKGNIVVGPSASSYDPAVHTYGIYVEGGAGGSNVSGNTLIFNPGVTIGSASAVGITVTSNHIIGGGISMASNVTAKGNTVIDGYGIYIGCTTSNPTVSGNTISFSSFGLDAIPVGFTPGVNTFHDLASISGPDGC